MAGLNENKMAKQESLAMTAAQNSDIRVARFLQFIFQVEDKDEVRFTLFLNKWTKSR